MTQIKNIHTNELKALISKNDCYIIDVREPDEYKSDHIPGAYNIPLSLLSAQTLADMQEKNMVFYCQSGVRSLKCSQKAADILKTDVYNLEGGFTEWNTLGNDVTRTGCGFPIMQQVHIIVGSMVLLGVMLSHIHHEAWIYFSGFFGLGLLFSGITGWCGMAKLLFLMPWNR